MSSIDERVVRMRMDDSQFQQGVNKTTSLLEKFKQSLNFKSGVESLGNLDGAIKKVDFNPVTAGLEAAKSGFNAFGAVAFAVTQRVTNEVINLSQKIAGTLTQSITSGFQEYETQMNAVQTILANTQSKGSTLNDVNAALDTLNTYADKTIYNFTEMTRNIGTFTAAGVGLQTSVDSIKGIANLAAVSGSSSAQASQAMYQLSQAIAAGKVQLMDWNSVVNAGMGGEVFQEALKRTARNFGTNVDGMIEKYGSFRESLTQGGWLTTDVLTETLKQLSGAYSEADLIAQGYTEEQAKQIVQLAKTAEGAATDVKTFSQLIDTSKEALASGWTQTFEIIFGDFEEAKELWSGVADVISQVVNESATSRNNLLQGWKDLGGRTELIKGLSNVFEALGKVLSTVGNAFRKVFPPTTSRQLMDMTEAFTSFTESLIPSESTLNKIGRVAEGVFAVFDIGVQIVKSIGTAFAEAFGNGGGSFLDTLLELAARFGDFLVSLDKGIKEFGIFEGIAKAVGSALGGTFNTISDVAKGLLGVGDSLSSVADGLKNGIGAAFDWILDKVQSVVNWIRENISGGDIFAGLAGGGIFLVAKKLGGAFDTIKEAVEGIFGNGGENLKKGAGVLNDVLDSLQGTLQSFTSGVKAFTLVEIAASITMLVHSIETMAELSGGDIIGGIAAIGGLMTELNLSLKAISKTMKGVKTTDLIKTGAALMEFAKAVEMLADAMSTIGNLNWDEIAKGLTGMGGAMAELVAAAKGLSYAKVNVKTAGSLIAMAQAVKMVADPLKKLGNMSWEQIGKGLSAMGGALAEMGTVTGLLGRFGKNNLSASVSMVLTAKSLGDIADAFGDFSKYNWGEIGRGLVAMGGALAEVGTVTGVLGKLAGFSGILGGGSILIAAQSLGDIAEAFGEFTQYNWDEIGRGLVAMGGALGEVALVSGALGKLAGLSGILGSGAILIAAQGLGDIANAFRSFTQYNWEEIGRGLVAMGGALGEVAVVSGALGALTGLSGLIGAGTITLAVQGLDEIARAFNSFTQYNWEEIGRGLVAMGGAIGEVAAISGITGVLTGVAGLMGAGTIALASQGLIDIATAFGKFTEFNWDEIGRGLAAMAGALGVTALGSLLNTLSGLGAGAISTVAVPLGQLADSVKKWSGVTVPDDLATNLGSLASGVMKFTLGGLGAGALSTAAPGMVQMANAVAKWSTISFPAGIESNLTALANGVKSFTFAFVGGWSLNAVVGPLGQLASAVNKWKDVTIPGGIQGKLTGLANGVKAFSTAFVGGWSIGAINEPLGKLAGAVKKWKDVTIPGGIQGKLTGLANGVKAFSTAFVGGWSLGAITEPLGKLAESVKKWNGVTIPGGIQGNLTALANGVKAFTGIGSGIAESMSNAASGVQAIATAATNLSAANLSGVSTQISTFVNSLNSTQSITSTLPQQISTFATQLSTAMTSLSVVVSINATIIGSAFSSLRTQINTAISGLGSIVSSNMSSASNAVASGASMISSGSSAIGAAFNRMTSIARSQLTIFSNTVRSSLTQAASSVRSSAPQFLSAGTQVVTSLTNGLKTGLNKIPTMFNSTISSAASNIRSFRSSFQSAGSYVAQGFASGIRSQIKAAANAAAALASAASSAAKAALDINSPSRVFAWIGEMTGAGFIDSIEASSKAAGVAGADMARSAISGAESIPNKFDDLFDFDTTLTPVLDLSQVEKQSGMIGIMLNDAITPIEARADSVSRRIGQNGGKTETKPDKSEPKVVNYNFNQTNNSPKALSRIDIYRDSKNLLSQAKGSR